MSVGGVPRLAAAALACAGHSKVFASGDGIRVDRAQHPFKGGQRFLKQLGRRTGPDGTNSNANGRTCTGNL